MFEALVASVIVERGLLEKEFVRQSAGPDGPRTAKGDPWAVYSYLFHTERVMMCMWWLIVMISGSVGGLFVWSMCVFWGLSCCYLLLMLVHYTSTRHALILGSPRNQSRNLMIRDHQLLLIPYWRGRYYIAIGVTTNEWYKWGVVYAKLGDKAPRNLYNRGFAANLWEVLHPLSHRRPTKLD